MVSSSWYGKKKTSNLFFFAESFKPPWCRPASSAWPAPEELFVVLDYYPSAPGGARWSVGRLRHWRWRERCGKKTWYGEMAPSFYGEFPCFRIMGRQFRRLLVFGRKGVEGGTEGAAKAAGRRTHNPLEGAPRSEPRRSAHGATGSVRSGPGYERTRSA